MKNLQNFQLGIVFPGQGSQSVGMLSDIAAEFSEVKTSFDQASSVLNYDLWQLVTAGPKDELDKTVHTQPALLAASYAIWQIFLSRGAMNPAVLAGHSLGEYTALVCAESLTFTDAILLVAARGQYMQEAVPSGTGAMAAIIGLDENTVNDLCQAACDTPLKIVSIANFNSPGQFVISGHKNPVERVIDLAKEKGAKMAVMLSVSVPSHCVLMQGAADKLALLLNKVNIVLPRIPVINNVNSSCYETEAQIRAGLIEQLYKPVRWVSIIQWFVKAGITDIIECGPGKVLTGLNKRIDKSLQLAATADSDSVKLLLKKQERGAY